MVLDEDFLSQIVPKSRLESSAEIDKGKDFPCKSVRQKVSGVRAAAWIGKGLAMRGHSGVSVVASVLLKLLLSGTSEVCHCSTIPHKFDSIIPSKPITKLCHQIFQSYIWVIEPPDRIHIWVESLLMPNIYSRT